MILIAKVFWRLQTAKDLVRPHSKKCRFRTSFNSQHVKVSQTLVKFIIKHFYHIFLSFWAEMIQKYLPYWSLKSYGCFLTHWLPMTSILFKVVRICSSLIKCNYLKNGKKFSAFRLPVLKSSSNFKHFQKKDHSQS